MKIEIGKSYSVSAKFKKSLVEVESWSNEETNQWINVETLWRNGTFCITPTNEEEVEMLIAGMKEDADEFELCLFEDWTVDDCFDGCSEDLYFMGTYEWTDEEKETIEDGYQEEWSSYLEETLNMQSEGCDYTIYNGIDIEEYLS